MDIITERRDVMLKTKISWADSTWNSISGCYHGCPYCYARNMTHRFSGEKYEDLQEPESYEVESAGGLKLMECNEQPYVVRDGKVKKIAYPYGFIPTFHRYRLNEYKNLHGRNIFVCSMADMFGEYIPDRWIIEIFEACKAAPQHNYLFLTKNPRRYVELQECGILPQEDNYWYGTTLTRADDTFMFGYPYKHFVSIEPLLEDFGESNHPIFADWVIIGAETGRRKDKVVPKREWVERIVDRCNKQFVPVFMKDNLADVWQGELIKEFPRKLQHG